MKEFKLIILLFFFLSCKKEDRVVVNSTVDFNNSTLTIEYTNKTNKRYLLNVTPDLTSKIRRNDNEILTNIDVSESDFYKRELRLIKISPTHEVYNYFLFKNFNYLTKDKDYINSIVSMMDPVTFIPENGKAKKIYKILNLGKNDVLN